jgi:HAD superfamily hydrolase (TIGR01549 family)
VHRFIVGDVYENGRGRYTVIRMFEKHGAKRVEVAYDDGRRAELLAEAAWEIHVDIARERGEPTVAWPSNMATRAVLLDLDDTVVDSRTLDGVRREARQGRSWNDVYARLNETSLADGFVPFLCELANIGQAAVVTSGPRSYAERLLEHHGLLLPVVVAYHDCASVKPHPAPLQLAATRLGVCPSECVYVGDEQTDEEAANRAGMTYIAVAGASQEPSGGCMQCAQVATEVRTWADEHPATGPEPPICFGPLVEGADDRTCVLEPYFPTRYPEFQNSASPMILNLKNGRWEAIEHFRAKLTDLIAPDAVIVCMPSSQAGGPPSGVRRLGQRLAAETDRLDATGLIRRHISIPSAHQGGPRSVAVHLGSCESDARLGQAVTGHRVVVIDDVTTTGSSLDAAVKLVEEYEPAEIVKVAIGRTTIPDAIL